MIKVKKKILFTISVFAGMFIFSGMGDRPVERDEVNLQKESTMKNNFYEKYGDDITFEAPYQIPGIRIYTKPTNLAKDPVTYLQTIVVDPDKIYNDMLEALKSINFIPASENEAINAAKLILYADDDSIKIYPNLDHYSGVENNYNVSISSPMANKRDVYYEVILFATKRSRGNFMKSFGLQKYIIEIGKDTYKMKIEDLPEK